MVNDKKPRGKKEPITLCNANLPPSAKHRTPLTHHYHSTERTQDNALIMVGG